jgi:hypothetical protein
MTFGLRGKMAAWFRIVYVLCLAAGTYTHASILVRHGWRLTLLDPLVAVLLFVRPRIGITALMLLMLSDVIHNTWVIHVYGGIVWMVGDQWLFLIFVFATARTFWKATQKQSQPRTP